MGYSSAPSGACAFNSFLLISDPVGIKSVSLTNMVYGKDGNTSVYLVMYNTPSGNGFVNLTVTNNDDVVQVFPETIKYTCLSLVNIALNPVDSFHYYADGVHTFAVLLESNLQEISHPFGSLASFIRCSSPGFDCFVDYVIKRVNVFRVILRFQAGYTPVVGNTTITVTLPSIATRIISVELPIPTSTENPTSTPTYSLTRTDPVTGTLWSSIQVVDPLYYVYSAMDFGTEIYFNTQDMIAYGNPNNYTMFSYVRIYEGLTYQGPINYRFISANNSVNQMIIDYDNTQIPQLQLLKSRGMNEEDLQESNNQLMADKVYTLQMINFEILTLEPRIHLMRITAADSEFGMKYVQLVDYISSTTVFSLNPENNLASGNASYGVFDVLYHASELVNADGEFDGLSITLMNENLTATLIAPFQFYNLDPLRQFPVFFAPYDYVFDTFDEITDLYFKYNEMDVSEKSMNNTMIFTTKNSNKQNTYYMAYERTDGQRPLFASEWVESIQGFTIEFTIPQKMFSGELLYNFTFLALPAKVTPHFKADWNLLQNRFGDKASVKIISDYADQIGPIVTQVQQVPGPTATVGANPIKIGFDLTLSDPVCGLKSAKFAISSSNGNLNYTKTIEPSAENNIYLDTYRIDIDVSPQCYNFQVMIEPLETFDTCGNKFSYQDSMFTIPYSNRTITVTCGNSVSDTTIPTVKNWNYTSTVDVGNYNRFINFTFELEDLESGIYIGQPSPSIIIQSLFHSGKNGYVICQSTLTNVTEFSAFFSCSVEVTYGFGYPDGLSFYSLSQVTNNQLQTGEYNNLEFNMDVQNSHIPILTRYSRITSVGGQLYLYGYSMGRYEDTKVYVNYHDTRGFQLVNTVNLVSPFVKGMIIGQSLVPYDIYIVVGNKTSEPITIVPDIADVPTPNPTSTPNETPSPSQCSGDQICNGNGQCVNGVCQCKEPWIGTACQSRVINATQPTTNTTHPTSPIDYNGTLPDGTQVSFTSLVSLLEVRELDFKKTLLERYEFQQWLFTNISTPVSTRFLYQTNITKPGQSLVTQINVTIEWFQTSYNVTFANEIIPMSPSTLKYNIESSKYPFSSKTNLLEYILSASMQSNDANTDSCAVQEFSTPQGNTQNVQDQFQYLKLQVNSQSLYGRFIKRAVLDGRIVTIDNELVEIPDTTTSTGTEAAVGIIVPFYYTLAQLDPDFSVLLDLSPVDSNENAVCGIKSEDKSGLTKAQLAGIIVGAICLGLIVVISISYYIYKRKRDMKINKRLSTISNR
ncbi:EGF-like domain-containing protein [Tieghemostelium lacteum]|uniref:EGF-like domain-containing protein n=1 Tax=Tieghemostelium lacteum TaxID=361077 RepID=A0A151Z495_TIELA|nr:EGF-like domain-containing protein [Tieghemostelium lacteum]|eukprot:KYQ88765.1 EGF-like domain-containing protein [Tieghemostelium lacteum]